MRPLLLLLSLTATLHATEYFTARMGSDTADGRSPQTAFATVTKGLAGLQPGDTLTILPGTYFESAAGKISGTPEAPITIRAQRPGTVLIHGDVDAPAFRLVEGMKRTYVADFKQRIEGIAERGTYRLYQPVATAAEVEEVNATYYQDDAAGRVYVHTSDSASANDRSLAFSVTSGFGILLTAPQGSKVVHDVVIDGLSFTGYQTREFPAEPGSRNRWGLAVINAEHVTVRRCSSYLNSGGIFLLAPTQCVVEDCQAYGNISRYQPVGNNILGWSISETKFRRNVVESFWPAGSSAGDITFYGGGAKTETSFGYMEDNIAINAGIMTKGSAKHSIQTGNVAVGSMAYYYTPQDETNLLLKDFLTPQAFRTYADPLNHDFRGQAESAGKGAANVFFVSPGGDDAAAGGSLKTAWRTLAHAAQVARPGDTVYLTAGEYHEALVPAQSGTAEKPIRFLRRGQDRVVLTGDNKLPVGVDLSGRAHVIVNGLLVREFTRTGITAQRGEALCIENVIATGIGGDGASFSAVKDLDFTHNLLRRCQGADLRLANCTTVNVTANVFDPGEGARLVCDDDSLAELWSDANAFPLVEKAADLIAAAGKKYPSLAAWQSATTLDPTSITVPVSYREADPERGDFALVQGSPLVGRAPGSTAIGPFHRLRVNRPVPVVDLALHEAGDTTATVEWSTPAQATESALEWGEDPACSHKISSPTGVFHTVSLSDLKPGTKYYYRVTSSKPYAEITFAPYLTPASADLAGMKTEPRTFQTATTAAPPRTLHVATNGDDHRTGLSAAEALRTINHAADLAHAGDTVLIHEGTYEETVVVRSSGTEKAPLIFRAAPGETVWMDGTGRFRTTAFRLLGKHYVEIDSLRFRHFRYAPEVIPIIQVQGGSHIAIRHCFHDGRESQGYVPAFIAVNESDHFLVENTVFINGMGEGLSANRCPDITVRHCVFYNNFIRALSVNQFDARLSLHISHNLFCDSLPWKTYNALLRVNPLDSLHSNHNVYFARLGAAERSVVETFSIKGKTVGHADPGQYRGETLALAAVQKEAAQETDSRFGNPGIRVVSELVPPKSIPSVWQKAEMRWEGKAFGPLDFADFFPDANNPLARATDGEATGLEPQAFGRQVP